MQPNRPLRKLAHQPVRPAGSLQRRQPTRRARHNLGQQPKSGNGAAIAIAVVLAAAVLIGGGIVAFTGSSAHENETAQTTNTTQDSEPGKRTAEDGKAATLRLDHSALLAYTLELGKEGDWYEKTLRIQDGPSRYDIPAGEFQERSQPFTPFETELIRYHWTHFKNDLEATVRDAEPTNSRYAQEDLPGYTLKDLRAKSYAFELWQMTASDRAFISMSFRHLDPEPHPTSSEYAAWLTKARRLLKDARPGTLPTRWVDYAEWMGKAQEKTLTK